MNDHRNDQPSTVNDDLCEWLVVSVSWAVAARDAAIELGDDQAAAEFTEQAREAIAAAQRAGISRDQLAAELDFPGGAAALEPATADRGGLDAHSGDRSEAPPPSSAELAARIEALHAGVIAEDDPGRAGQLARWHRDDDLAEAGLSTEQGAIDDAGSDADVCR